VPGWVADLHVMWDENDNESRATMTTQQEYRQATLTLAAAFLSDPVEKRAQVMRHEIMHLPTQPLVDVLASLLDACGVDDKLKAWAMEQIRKAQEGAVCDLEIMLRTAVPPAATTAIRER
jgi:hypothetical protein